MSLKVMYNDIAKRYKNANRFGSISVSHQSAINQIQRAQLGKHLPYRILDLGVGNGSFLQRLQQYIPQAQFTGIDISPEMLKRANEKLNLTLIEASATEASHFLPHHSQDLVLAHFINAYIPIDTLFHQAHLLTKMNGHFSMVTTTYDSFPNAQALLAQFIAKESVLSSIVGHYYKAVVKNTTVAASKEDLFAAFEKHHFKVIDHQRLYIPITINSIEELALFGIEGTWFLNTMSIRMLPKNFLLQRLKRLFAKIFEFPYQDTHIIDVILAKK